MSEYIYEKRHIVAQKFPIKKCRKNKRNVISPLEHPSKNCCCQDSLINAQISGKNFEEKQNICIASKYHHQNINHVRLLTYFHGFIDSAPCRR